MSDFEDQMEDLVYVLLLLHLGRWRSEKVEIRANIKIKRDTNRTTRRSTLRPQDFNGTVITI